MPAVSLARGSALMWDARSDGSARLALGPGSPGLRFDVTPCGLCVGLETPVRQRPVDVTIQPGLVVRLVTEAARAEDVDPAAACRAAGTSIAELAHRHGFHEPARLQGEGLLSIVLAATHPLAGLAMAGGRAGPIREVPRWASPALRATTARAGAETAFGPATTRRLVSSFASSLVPPAPSPSDAGQPRCRHLALYPFALALMGEGVLNADRLSNVLEGTDPWRRFDSWPTVEQITQAREVFARLGAARVSRVLGDASILDDGPGTLNRTLGIFGIVANQLPARLPHGLRDLHDLCVSTLPTDPRPDHQWDPGTDGTGARRHAVPDAANLVDRIFFSPGGGGHQGRNGANRRGRRGAGPSERRGPAPPPRALPLPREALTPPVTALAGAGAPGPGTPIRYRATVAAVNGAERDGIQLVLPRTPAELAAWGRVLGNCIGSFSAAAVEGASILIGVTTNGRLTYCLELTTHGMIRQFLGVHNRAVPRADAAAVTGLLLDAGLLDRAAQQNRAWVDNTGQPAS